MRGVTAASKAILTIAMADAKSMLESIARSFGYIYGREKHVRINIISQSLQLQQQVRVSRISRT